MSGHNYELEITWDEDTGISSSGCWIPNHGDEVSHNDQRKTIVSAIYAAGTSDGRCRTIVDPVFTQDFKTIVGCRAIGPKIKF